jgi:NAD(P)H-hydrate epimerase
VTLDDLPLVRAVPSVTAAQMAEVDRITIEEFHIAVDVLMENASRQIAATVRAVLGGTVASKRVIGLVGTGNNGGDTAGALRHLVNWGARVCAEVAAPQQRQRESTRLQLGRLLAATTSEVAIVHDAWQKGFRDLDADVIVDGLLGYSARGAPRETVAALIDAANASHLPILAVDLPSGIDPDTGATPGTAIRAAGTVTLALPKAGLVVAARENLGDLVLADIGIPHASFAKLGVDTWRLFEQGDLVRIVG